MWAAFSNQQAILCIAPDANMSHKYAGEDALAYQEGHADLLGSVNHVQKRLQKRKGIEVVFDPKGHR